MRAISAALRGRGEGVLVSLYRYTIAALTALPPLLVACGGGSGEDAAQADTALPAAAAPAASQASQTSQTTPVTPDVPSAGAPVSLQAYAAARSGATEPVLPAAEALRAGLALALPPLQVAVQGGSGSYWSTDTAVVLPGLQAARLAVLRAASAGETLAELQAALPTGLGPNTAEALLAGVSRQLFAPASAQFDPRFLAATDLPGSAGAARWQATTVQDGASATAALGGYGDASPLALSSQTRLVIGQRFAVDAAAGGQAVAFDGVGVRSPDTWYTAPMVALEGPGGTLLGEDYTVTATWVGDHLWLSLRPRGDAPLFQGLAPASLAAGLSAAWAAYATPASLVQRSRQVWPRQTLAPEDRSRLPAGITLPYDRLRANLQGLDGGGTYLVETVGAASLTVDAAGLRASGAQAMAFNFSPDNGYGGGSTGAGATQVLPEFSIPSACPRAEPDWRGAYLALIDRAGRLLLVATLPNADAVATTCARI